MKILGPYKRGEIPDPTAYVFLDANGNPITALPPGAVARLEFRRWGSATVVEVDATIINDPASGAERCAAQWEWPDDAMAVAADFRGEVWAGLDSGNKYASEDLTWTVEPSIAVPTLT